jgi:hypothetical protein
MKEAGIDFGSTLIKTCHLGDDGKLVYRSGADLRVAPGAQLAFLAGELKGQGVDTLKLAGIKSDDFPLWLKDMFTVSLCTGDDVGNVRHEEGDLIWLEKRLQADGTKRILEDAQYNLDDGFLLVSIGTGVSYTQVLGDYAIRPLPIGNTKGGAFIRCIGNLMGERDLNRMDGTAFPGKAQDLLVKDVWPNANKSLHDFVVADFGKFNEYPETWNKADFYRTLYKSVATGIISDILRMGDVKTVVFIGTTIARSSTLHEILMKMTCKVGLNRHFPKNGEYALARGAFHAKSYQI